MKHAMLFIKRQLYMSMQTLFHILMGFHKLAGKCKSYKQKLRYVVHQKIELDQLRYASVYNRDQKLLNSNLESSLENSNQCLIISSCVYIIQTVSEKK